jgi:hypothetical protein
MSVFLLRRWSVEVIVAKGGVTQLAETRANWPVIDNYLLFQTRITKCKTNKKTVFVPTSVSIVFLT